MIEGQDGPDNVGDYQQTWYVGGIQVGPVLSFWVHFSPSGVTILVNGSFDDSPDWVNPGSDTYVAIIAAYANNVALGNESHSDLHTAPIWINMLSQAVVCLISDVDHVLNLEWSTNVSLAARRELGLGGKFFFESGLHSKSFHPHRWICLNPTGPRRSDISNVGLACPCRCGGSDEQRTYSDRSCQE